jgi:hypothetical protein
MSTSRRHPSAGKRKHRRRGNQGSFKAGPDPRRHVFTRQDCWLGYAVTYIRHPHLRDWLKLRVILSKRKDASHTSIFFTEAEGVDPDPSFSEEAIPF